MQRVAFDDVDPHPQLDTDRRGLTDPLDADGLALNRFTLAPGEWCSGLHCHEDQEEVYVVLDGTLTVETLDGDHSLDTDEAARFAPGEYHAGRNDGDEPVRLLALGTPRESEAIRVPLGCPDCGQVGLRPAMGEDGPILGCPDCLGETAATCDDCGSTEMRATVPEGRDRPAGVCQECGAVRDV
jgi:uncharacterized cupin superfamily protein